MGLTLGLLKTGILGAGIYTLNKLPKYLLCTLSFKIMMILKIRILKTRIIILTAEIYRDPTMF